MQRWTPEEIRLYKIAIKKAPIQEAEKKSKHEKWLNDFIDGKLKKGGHDEDPTPPPPAHAQ